MSPKDQDVTGNPADPRSIVHPLLEPSDYTKFLLRAKAEILFVLRSLLASTDHITIYFDEGKHFLLSAIIQVDDEGLTLDYGGDEKANSMALTVDRLFCVTTHERIRIQFLLRGLHQIDYQGAPAFRASLPDAVLRLQRREFYRLTTPIAHPIKCQLPVTTKAGTNSTIMEANVVDISGGGLAMMAPPEGLFFSAGDVFENCRVELPGVGVVIVTLETRNVFEITLRSGARVTRAGCQFTHLPKTMLTLIQRYIIKVERERKARDSGMA
jgi:flagellar brake protein